MAITKLERDFNIVSALDNEPNDVSGMTADDLKAKFDEGSKAIQTYINETLIPETEQEIGKVYDHVGEVRGNLQEDIDSRATKEEVRDIVLGQIPDNSISAEKLTPEVRERSYTKEETISASTKENFGLPETANADDAFKDIKERFDGVPAQIESADKVGDVKVTIRNEINEKWLPCDGGPLSANKYPQLYPLLPAGDVKYTSTPSNRDFEGVVYFKGYFVSPITNSDQTSISNISLYAACTHDPSKSSNTITKNLKSGNANGASIACSDDMVYISLYASATVYLYRSSAPETEVWESASASIHNQSGINLKYLNNKLVAACYNGDYTPQIIEFTDPADSSTWVKRQISNTTQCSTIDLDYGGGKWAAAYTRDDKSIYVAYADSLDGEWTELLLTANNNYDMAGITYHNGTWYVCGKNNLWYTQNLGGEWAMATLNGVPAEGTKKYFDVVNDYFIIGGSLYSSAYGVVYYTKDPLGEWQNYEMASKCVFSQTAYGDGKWMSGLTEGTGSNTGRWLYSFKYVPEITIDGANAFIKAKE